MTRNEMADKYYTAAVNVTLERYVVESLLDEVDGLIYEKITKHYESCDGAPTFGDGERQVLAQPPFDRLYRHWLDAQVALRNEENTRYENAYILFNQAVQDFAEHFHRSHMPKTSGTWRF